MSASCSAHTSCSHSHRGAASSHVHHLTRHITGAWHRSTHDHPLPRLHTSLTSAHTHQEMCPDYHWQDAPTYPAQTISYNPDPNLCYPHFVHPCVAPGHAGPTKDTLMWPEAMRRQPMAEAGNLQLLSHLCHLHNDRYTMVTYICPSFQQRQDLKIYLRTYIHVMFC